MITLIVCFYVYNHMAWIFENDRNNCFKNKALGLKCIPTYQDVYKQWVFFELCVMVSYCLAHSLTLAVYWIRQKVRRYKVDLMQQIEDFLTYHSLEM